VLQFTAGRGVVLCGEGASTASPERAICARSDEERRLMIATPDVPIWRASRAHLETFGAWLGARRHILRHKSIDAPRGIRGGVVMNRSRQRLLVVAGVSGTIVVASIVIGTILGEFPEAVWVFLVPIGTFGAGLVCIVSLGMFFARGARRV
jgi:hypothetical protein